MKNLSDRKVTQHNVARLAGVSQTTVSLVLKNSTDNNISEKTRQRVLEAVKKLDYIPDRTAQSLRTNKTYTIAAIIPDITNPFYPTFVRGIQDISREYNYDLITYNTDGQEAEEYNYLQSVKKNRADGVIVTAFHLKQADLLELHCPVVQFTQKPTTPPLHDSIFIDNIAAAETVVSHLIEKGHQRIGMIAGQEDTPPRLNRIKGYQQALQKYHVSFNDLLIRGGDFSESGGYDAMRELLQLKPRVTAVFAANDLMAIGAINAIHAARLRVPEDIAVAGMDDIPAANLMSPKLTTLTQYQGNIGRRAAEMLFERINDQASTEVRLVEMPFSLIVREST